MKKTFQVAVTILLFSAPSFAQDPVWISNSDIKEVKIYQQGAMVSRTAKTMVNQGVQELIFDGLSPFINPQSIQVKGLGDATILSVQFQQNYLKEKRKSAEVLQLEGLLDSLQVKSMQVKNKLSVLGDAQALLQSNKMVGGSNNGLAADKLEQVTDYFMRKMTALKEEQLQTQQKEKKLSEQVAKVQQQLNQLQQKRQQSTGTIVVRLDARSRGAASFELNYIIATNVSWIAFYDIRATDVQAGKVDLVHKAKVNQSTGEDWDKVKLSLSTGNPALGTERPVLHPWYLDFLSSHQKTRHAEHMGQYDQAMPAMAEGALMKVEDKNQMTTVAVRAEEQTLAANFEILQPYSIPSDGQDYQVDIQRHALNARFQYVAVPKLDTDVFLTARVSGWEALSLSPGAANVYFEDAFTGETYIDPAAVNDTLVLSLGRDKRIVVKRDKLTDLSGTKLLGSTKQRSLGFEISVRNGKKESIDLVLLDQVPGSMQKDIEVRVEELSGAAHNTETGELSWKLKIASGETVKKRFGFTVKYPKDKVVLGL